MSLELSLLNRFHKHEYFHYIPDVGFSHRAPFKVILNPILRLIQFWDDEPYVVATMVDYSDDVKIPPLERVKFKGYELRKVGRLGSKYKV